MLVRLTVRNIALIECLTVDFHRGLHVLTGETGAGKSIVVDSINLVLGERADRSLIRTGAEKASVEALIDVSDCPAARELLTSEGLELDGCLMSILREITTSERNLCRICGVVMPLGFLRQLSSLLVDVHGQHEHQSLLNEKNHLGFLDAFGDETYGEQIASVAVAYKSWKESSTTFAALRKEHAQREQRKASAFTRWQELDAAKLHAGEEAELSLERARFADSERISLSISEAYALLSGSGESGGGAAAELQAASESMHRIAPLHEDYATLAQRLSALYYEADELSVELRALTASQRFDPVRSEEVQERFDLLRRLERRYNMPVDELVAHRNALREELDLLEKSTERLESAEKAFKDRLHAYRGEAEKLTKLRKALALRFQDQMTKQLSELGMERTRLLVRFEEPQPGQKRVPTSVGDDQVAFYISPNLGEALKPLGKTASGGELSRLMLAIKTIAAGRNSIPCMIFDEVDTGISGHVAGVVAEKMARIARDKQVICVTHLPQIAAMADTQYQVSKSVEGARTLTNVEELDDAGREREVARLVGAEGAHERSGLEHARNMLHSAVLFKRSIRTEYSL